MQLRTYFLTALLLSTTCFLQATTVVKMEAAKLIDDAELIFVGTAIYSESVTTGDDLYAFTFVTFEVEGR